MIVSTQNGRLKRMRLARRCKGEDALIEGPHLLDEALNASLDVHGVLTTPDFLARPEARALLDRLRQPPATVDPTLLGQLADSDSPRGIVALAYLPRGGVEALPVVADGLYVYLDGVQDPGNLGALVRTAEAAGVAGMALGPGCAHPNHPRALRASAGSLLRVPIARAVSPAALDAHCAGHGAKQGAKQGARHGTEHAAPSWLALVPRDGVSIYDAQPAGCLILALGAEGAGLSATVAARADVQLSIPLAPPVESLNVTVAAAITLFELRRRDVTSG